MVAMDYPGVYICRLSFPISDITVASDGESIVGLWFDGQRHFGSTLSPDAVEMQDREEFRQVTEWLDGYFRGTCPGWLPEVGLTGTDFRKRVWHELMLIPYGKTVTYGQLAERLGSSPRAVASAIGHNPVSILVPCHRVVGWDGRLTGYAAGIYIKNALLSLEAKYRPALNREE